MIYYIPDWLLGRYNAYLKAVREDSEYTALLCAQLVDMIKHGEALTLEERRRDKFLEVLQRGYEVEAHSLETGNTFLPVNSELSEEVTMHTQHYQAALAYHEQLSTDGRRHCIGTIEVQRSVGRDTVIMPLRVHAMNGLVLHLYYTCGRFRISDYLSDHRPYILMDWTGARACTMEVFTYDGELRSYAPRIQRKLIKVYPSQLKRQIDTYLYGLLRWLELYDVRQYVVCEFVKQ